MSRPKFGTDGVRGVANQALTPEFALALGISAGRRLIKTKRARRAIVCRDTRQSGPMLEAALSAGLASVGVAVDSFGVAPTPAVCFAARAFDYGLGVVVSASHNPAPDNGIKLIGPDGRKLGEDDEKAIEAGLDAAFDNRPLGGEVGWIKRVDAAPVEAYLRFLEAMVPGRLQGVRVAVDAAHGAAYRLAPELLTRLGAEVVLTGAEPDGVNINAEGGATKPENVQRLTVEEGCAWGVAFDGDADRAVFCDAEGRLINGDRTMALWAGAQRKLGKFSPAVVVGTVMTNGGLERYLDSIGVALHRANVGDKYVSRMIDEHGALIGGEQSGHIIFSQHGPTGDGLATMAEFAHSLSVLNAPASAAMDLYEPWPQLLTNVQIAPGFDWANDAGISEALESAKTRLEGHGRLNVRASGTQPMIRVMVEADEPALRDAVADAVVAALCERAEGSIYSQVDLTHALGD